VLDQRDVDPNLVGKNVTAEGTLIGIERLRADWIGETSR